MSNCHRRQADEFDLVREIKGAEQQLLADCSKDSKFKLCKELNEASKAREFVGFCTDCKISCYDEATPICLS